MERALGIFETAETLTDRCAPFNVVGVIELANELEPEPLRAALDRAQRRHPLLRARIVDRDGVYHYELDDVPPIPLEVVARESEDHWQEIAQSELNRPFELATGPLMRSSLLVGEPGTGASELVLSFLHTMIDGVSATNLVREILSDYETIAGGGSLGEIRERLAELALPEGYAVEFGGEDEERQKAFAGLWQAMVLAMLAIYGLLAIQFNSFVQPLVILLTVPLGITGAIIGLLITGNPFGLMAFIGVISLTGIIINDSIVLADFANYLQRVEGRRRIEALIEAGQLRFRPVVLTSVTTIGGLTPLAIWGGTLWSPLACAVIFGLIGSTVLILVVLPVLYSVLVGAAEARRSFHAWGVIGRRLLGD